MAWQLLARWGVVAWELWSRESYRIPWRDVVRALRRLEARGEALGGRFVAGISGEQYASPEAASLLADVRRDPGGGHEVKVAGADPLNLTGTVLGGPRVPSVRDRTVRYRGGVPAAGAGRPGPSGPLPGGTPDVGRLEVSGPGASRGGARVRASLGPDRRAVLHLVGVVGQPGDGRRGGRGGSPEVVAHQPEGGGIGHLALGLHVAGIEVEGPDAPAAELHGQQRGHAVEGGLRGGVGQPPSTLPHRSRGIGGGRVRGDVDDHAAAGVQHAGQHRLDQDDWATTLAASFPSSRATGRSRMGTMLPGPVSTALLTSRSTPPQASTTRATALEGGPVEEVGGQLQGRPPAARTSAAVSSRLPGRGRPAPVSEWSRPSPVDGPAADGDVPSALGQGHRRGLADAPGGPGDQCPT